MCVWRVTFFLKNKKKQGKKDVVGMNDFSGKEKSRRIQCQLSKL